MTAATLTLTDFLLARIAEDEAEVMGMPEPNPFRCSEVPLGMQPQRGHRRPCRFTTVCSCGSRSADRGLRYW